MKITSIILDGSLYKFKYELVMSLIPNNDWKWEHDKHGKIKNCLFSKNTIFFITNAYKGIALELFWLHLYCIKENCFITSGFNHKSNVEEYFTKL